MPINKNAAFRYRIIDRCLRNHLRKYPSIDYLQEKITEMLGLDKLISISSINKDFKTMRNYYNAPIKFDKSRGGYYYEDPYFSINSFPLTEEEIRVLDISTAFLKQLKFSGYFQQFETAIDKLISGFRISAIPGFEQRVLLSTEEPTANTGVGWLEQLYYAIIEKSPLQITYQRFNTGQSKLHHLSPYVLREYRNRWYVTGYSKEAKSLVSLALDRIHAIDHLPGSFHETVDFNPEEYFKYSFGVTVYPNVIPEKVQLLFNKNLEGYLVTKPLHHSQQIEASEDGLIVTMTCYLTPELEMTILSYGEQVKVLAPNLLVNKIKKRVEALSYVYR